MFILIRKRCLRFLSSWSVLVRLLCALLLCIDHRIQKTIITNGVFFHKFAEYLESVVMSSDKLLIIGDLNIHMDVPTNPNIKHYTDPLDTMGLVQHVKQATHLRGHILAPISTHANLITLSLKSRFLRVLSPILLP